MFYIQLESSRIKFVDVLGYEMTSSIPFPHISTWLEQQAFYKQPVSTMNIHEHGFKHGAGHSHFSPAKGKTTARRNSPNLWQMKAAAAEPIWVGNIQVM